MRLLVILLFSSVLTACGPTVSNFPQPTAGETGQGEGFKKGTKLYLDCMQTVMQSRQEYARQQSQKNQALIDMGRRIQTEGFGGTGYNQPRQMTCQHQGQFTRCNY